MDTETISAFRFCLYLLFSCDAGGYAISLQKTPRVTFGLPYLLIELFYFGMPVVQMVCWKRSVYGHMITKFSGMGRFTYPWCSTGARALL